MRFIVTFLFCASLFAQNVIRILPKGNNSAVGHVDFAEKSNAHTVGLAAPDSLTTNTLYRLPDHSAPGCWTDDGSGNLSSQPCAGGANSIIVSAAHPMQLYSHFTDSDKTHIRFSFSRDYTNFKPVNAAGFGPNTENRDVSIYDDGTTFYIVASPTPGASSKAQFWTTTDMITIKGPTTIDMTSVLSGTNADYAPEWFIDPVGGTINTLHALSINGGTTFTPYLVKINLAAISTCTGAGTANCSAALGTFTALTLNGTAQNHTFDYYMVWDVPSSKYYLFYVDEYVTSGTGAYYQKLAYATSTTLTGTYTQVTTATSPTNADHFAFSNTTEAPSVLRLIDSVSLALYGVVNCYRIYEDTFTNDFNSNNNVPRNYNWQSADTCPASSGSDPFAVVKTAPVPLNISKAEHGTVLSLTSQARAAIVYNAADYWKNGAITEDRQRFGEPVYTPYDGITVIKDLPTANYFLGNVSPPGFHAGSLDPSAVSQPRSFAELAYCGVDAHACPPPYGGEGRWINSYQGAGGGGQIQLNSTNIDINETSIAFLNGAYAYGPSPLVASSLGKKGIWDAGINNQCFGPVAGCANRANNWWYLYNAGLGPIGGAVTVTNPGFEAASISGWSSASFTATTTDSHSGSYSAMSSSTTAIYILQTISGLTSGVTYEYTAWLKTSAGSTCGGFLQIDNGSTNQTTGVTVNPIGEWYQLGLQYTADSTGNARLIAYTSPVTGSSCSGTVYFDDFQLYPISISGSGPSGAFPIGVSAWDGSVRVNYALTLGLQDTTALTSLSAANINAFGFGLVEIGSGTSGKHDAYVQAGGFANGGLTGDAFWSGPYGANIGNLATTGTGLWVLGNGSAWNDNHANLSLGSATLGNSTGDGIFVGGTQIYDSVANNYLGNVATAGYVAAGAMSANTLQFAISGGTGYGANFWSNSAGSALCGNGTLGTYNCNLFVGTLAASGVVNTSGLQISSTAVTSGTNWIGGVSTPGTVATAALTNNTQQFALVGGSGFSVSLESTTANTLFCGDSTIGDRNCIFDAGVVNAATSLEAPYVNFSTALQYASSNLTSGANWISGVNAPSSSIIGNIISPQGAFKTNFAGNNDVAGYLTMSGTTGFGTAGYTFGQTYNATYKPICVGSYASSVASTATPVIFATSNTGFVLSAQAGSTVGYVCVGRQ